MKILIMMEVECIESYRTVYKLDDFTMDGQDDIRQLSLSIRQDS